MLKISGFVIIVVNLEMSLWPSGIQVMIAKMSLTCPTGTLPSGVKHARLFQVCRNGHTLNWCRK